MESWFNNNICINRDQDSTAPYKKQQFLVTPTADGKCIVCMDGFIIIPREKWRDPALMDFIDTILLPNADADQPESQATPEAEDKTNEQTD
jgi:hypothetical protein